MLIRGVFWRGSSFYLFKTMSLGFRRPISNPYALNTLVHLSDSLIDCRESQLFFLQVIIAIQEVIVLHSLSLCNSFDWKVSFVNMFCLISWSKIQHKLISAQDTLEVDFRVSRLVIKHPFEHPLFLSVSICPETHRWWFQRQVLHTLWTAHLALGDET